MIEVRNLTKTFAGHAVLTDVSLKIEDGQTFALIGRSGSGKSVLLKHIIGLMSPDAGTVIVDGENLASLDYPGLRRLRRRFGVLFQGGALFDSMNAFDNVAFPLRAFTNLSPEAIRTRAFECLGLVELSNVEHRFPNELSGGMQKRVALARAIAVNPRYVFYDEPTSGLDPETSKTIDDLVTRLAQELGATSIVVSHDMHSVLRIADTVGFLHDSRLRWMGTIAELHHAEDPVLRAFVRANEYQIGSTPALAFDYVHDQ